MDLRYRYVILADAEPVVPEWRSDAIQADSDVPVLRSPWKDFVVTKVHVPITDGQWLLWEAPILERRAMPGNLIDDAVRMAGQVRHAGAFGSCA